ncbi:MAG: glycosyltransferase family 39 protein [Bacteroidia bacterium]|nr:glycosyltransferase family 39 protein [Bacteroidia bacterium]
MKFRSQQYVPQNTAAALLMLTIVAFCTLFYNLGANQMHMWDESSYAITAYDMLKRNEWIQTYFLGEPDLYNTKPPFALWCMAASIRMFGFTEFAVRLPSALAALATAILLFVLGFHHFRNQWKAIFAPIILLTANGYLGEHIATTADTDAILAFWITLYGACFYIASQHQTRHSYYAFAGFIALTLACFTKGPAGLLAVPGIVLWFIWSKQFKRVIRTKGFILGVFFFIAVIGGYYFYRNHTTPNYLATVIHYEIMGRITQQEFLDPVPKSFWYYLIELVKSRFVPWSWLTIPLIVLYLFAKKNAMPPILKATICYLVSIAGLLGLSATKPFWYDAPLYPWIAACIGWILASLSQEQPKASKLIGITVCIITIIQVILQLQKPIQTNLKNTWQMAYNHMPQKDTLYIVNMDFDFRLNFYQKQFETKGMLSRIVKPNHPNLQVGNWVICPKQARSHDLQQLFEVDTIFTDNDCYLYRITKTK